MILKTLSAKFEVKLQIKSDRANCVSGFLVLRYDSRKDP